MTREILHVLFKIVDSRQSGPKINQLEIAAWQITLHL